MSTSPRDGMQPENAIFRAGAFMPPAAPEPKRIGAVKDHASEVPDGLATTPAPVACATYDPDRWMEVQSFVPEANHHSRLPDGVNKHQAINTVCAALRLIGAAEKDIAAWRLIADVTDRQAWTAPDRSPVNWRRQCDLARALGITDRSMRRIENRLAGYGVLARMTADNGYRGRRSGQPYGAPISCGLSVEPAIANYRALAGIVEEAEIAEEARKQKALEARTARRRVGILVGCLDDIEMRHWAKGRLDELDEALRPASTRVASHVDLSAWLAALVALEREIRDAMTPFPEPDGSLEAGPVPATEQPRTQAAAPAGREIGATAEERPGDIVANQPDMSGAPDSGVRCHIQPVQESNCIQGENGQAPTAPQHRHREPPGPIAGMTLDDLRTLASDDMAFWLDATDDWQDAVPQVLHQLGINASAWHEACDAMGPARAFLALLVIDRNRYHPKRPVESPGGALRAFAAKAREGGLNLAGSVAGIRARTRKGLQPKGPDRSPRPS